MTEHRWRHCKIAVIQFSSKQVQPFFVSGVLHALYVCIVDGVRPPYTPKDPPRPWYREFSVPCILVVELCERLVFYSMTGNMVLFCTSALGYSNADAITINTAFIGQSTQIITVSVRLSVCLYVCSRVLEKLEPGLELEVGSRGQVCPIRKAI